MRHEKSSQRPNRKTLSDHPHYFGAFLNTARHNAFMVMEHLVAKHAPDFQPPPGLEKDSMDYAKMLLAELRKELKKPDVAQAAIRDFRRHFSFLNYEFFLHEETKQQELAKPKSDRKIPDLPEPKPEKVLALFENAITLLSEFRNKYSHYVYQKRNSVGIETLPLQTIFKSAVFRLTDRSKNTKRFDVFEKEHVAHLSEGTSIFLPIDPTIKPNHEKTVAFFTCLFLERKHAFQLLSHLDGFQNTATQEPSLELRASNECYAMYCCRLPQPKLESSDIMLDMLNELGRFPDELYRLLSEEDKKRFHVKLDAEVGSDEDLNSDEFGNESVEVQQEVVLKRHGDRFPYFALRYFDDTEAFPTLRFDVHLGKRRIKKPYPKIIFKEERRRILTQDLHDYTRLNRSLLELGENMMYRRMEDGKLVGFVNATFAKKFHPTWLNTDGDGQIRLRDEIEQFSPQYNVGVNVIGFKFIDTNPQNHPFLLPNFTDYKNEKPDAIISTYELRNLFLYHYLYTKGHIKIDAEVFIKNFIDKMGKLFNVGCSV